MSGIKVESSEILLTKKKNNLVLAQFEIEEYCKRSVKWEFSLLASFTFCTSCLVRCSLTPPCCHVGSPPSAKVLCMALAHVKTTLLGQTAGLTKALYYYFSGWVYWMFWYKPMLEKNHGNHLILRDILCSEIENIHPVSAPSDASVTKRQFSKCAEKFQQKSIVLPGDYQDRYSQGVRRQGCSGANSSRVLWGFVPAFMHELSSEEEVI